MTTISKDNNFVTLINIFIVEPVNYLPDKK
jgi:hypothetical protein